MSSDRYYLLSIAFLLALILSTQSALFAEASDSGMNDEPLPATQEVLLASNNQTSGAINAAPIYAELRDVLKKIKKAKGRDADQRLHQRAEELMGQLFDAKVQQERHRIQLAEERIANEKRKLEQMQQHKGDLVHSGLQKALDNGEMPEWAPRKEPLNE